MSLEKTDNSNLKKYACFDDFMITFRWSRVSWKDFCLFTDNLFKKNLDDFNYFFLEFCKIPETTHEHIEYIISKGIHDFDQAFLKSCASGSIQRVQYFLKKGVDINCDEGRALNIAITYSHEKLSNFLIDNSITITQEHFDIATSSRLLDIAVRIFYLGNFNIEDSHINAVVNLNNFSMIKLFLEKGIDPNKIALTAINNSMNNPKQCGIYLIRILILTNYHGANINNILANIIN